MSKEAQLSFKAVLKVCHSRVIWGSTSHRSTFLQLYQLSMREKLSACYPSPHPPLSTHSHTRGKGNERPHLKPTTKSQLKIFFCIVVIPWLPYTWEPDRMTSNDEALSPLLSSPAWTRTKAALFLVRGLQRRHFVSASNFLCLSKPLIRRGKEEGAYLPVIIPW